MARVAIAAGGTAGHVVPALAVADALRDRGAEVSFLGAHDRLEAQIVPAAGYPLDLLRLEGIDRGNPLRAARAAALATRAVPAARGLLREREVDVVMGGGGYVAGPVGLAALSLRLPLVLTEADRHLGLANRLLARRARRVCLAFPIPGLDGDRYRVTGRPVPAAILEADRADARRRFGIDPSDSCLLVFGGSQGARSINLCALEAFLGSNGGERAYHVLHIAGHRDYRTALQRLEAAGGVRGGTEAAGGVRGGTEAAGGVRGGTEAADGVRGGTGSARYTLLEYEPNLGDALAASDLVLARSGGSVFELAAAGRPAILVPYPHAAAGHQHANAEWMAEGGAAIVIEDSELSPARLLELVAELFADGERLERMAVASRALARPDAAERIAEEILAAAE